MAATPTARGLTHFFLQSLLAIVLRPGMTSEPDPSDNRELNYDLMWTWFLPNPLWAPRRRKRKWFSNSGVANLLRSDFNNSEAKTRRKN
jgi:hypothetical protein